MVELVISAPDTVAVLAGGMPDFGAAQVAALAALYPSGENVNTAVPAQALATSLQLTLDHVKNLRRNDGLMVVFLHSIRDLALIEFLPLGEKVYCI